MRKFIIIIIWMFMSACVLLLVTLPVNLQTQLIAGATVLFIMMVLKTLNAGGIWRLIALAFGTAIVMRYVYWRTTSTLPPINQLENFIPGFLLYLAEMYSVMMLALSLFVVAMPLPQRTTAHHARATCQASTSLFRPTTRTLSCWRIPWRRPRPWIIPPTS